MRSIHRREESRSPVRVNMTPLIDVTFLLLTFFMLASHFASAEKVQVDLPRPDDSQAEDRRIHEKVIITMVYGGKDVPADLRLGPFGVPTVDLLAARLAAVAERNLQTQIILRADRRIPYGEVREVMEAIAAQGLSRLQVVAELNRP